MQLLTTAKIDRKFYGKNVQNQGHSFIQRPWLVLPLCIKMLLRDAMYFATTSIDQSASSNRIFLFHLILGGLLLSMWPFQFTHFSFLCECSFIFSSMLLRFAVFQNLSNTPKHTIHFLFFAITRCYQFFFSEQTSNVRIE